MKNQFDDLFFSIYCFILKLKLKNNPKINHIKGKLN